MRPQISAVTSQRGGDTSLASPAARPGSGPDGANTGQWKAGQVQSTEEFLRRFGDAIDDRITDVLDEREALRPRSRLRSGFGALALLAAVTATILLRHAAVAVAAVWVSTAAVCLAAAWTTRAGRP
jgi:hypothetical protein